MKFTLTFAFSLLSILSVILFALSFLVNFPDYYDVRGKYESVHDYEDDWANFYYKTRPNFQILCLTMFSYFAFFAFLIFDKEKNYWK